MRVANLSGRLNLVEGSKALDVETASQGRFPSDPQAIYSRWAEFNAWASGQDIGSAGSDFSTRDLGPSVPRPPQVFAIGLNYADHASESNLAIPENPVVFTKFVSSLTGADVDVRLTGDTVDWEAELVAVVGAGGRNIPESEGWNHIAGLTVGQDLSDRTVQWWGNPAQFSLGKSMAGFAPLGPVVVSVDEVSAEHDRDDLRIGCTLTESDGSTRVLQDGRTGSLIFSIPVLVARLSAIVELLPGDIIFTGTPAGVGMGRTPAEYLKAGQTLTTEIEGIGTLVQRFTPEIGD